MSAAIRKHDFFFGGGLWVWVGTEHFINAPKCSNKCTAWFLLHSFSGQNKARGSEKLGGPIYLPCWPGKNYAVVCQVEAFP